MIDGKQVVNRANPSGTGKYHDERGRYVDLPQGLFAVITANANFNFENETDSVVITVANTLLTNANFKSFSFVPIENSSTFFEDFYLNGLIFTVVKIADNLSFDLRATAVNNASGIYTINYKILY